MLLLDVADPRPEAAAEHREGCEVDLRVAVSVRVVLLELEVALIVESPSRTVAASRSPLEIGVDRATLVLAPREPLVRSQHARASTLT